VATAAPAIAAQLALASGRKLSLSIGGARRAPITQVDDRTSTWSALDLGLSQHGVLLISSDCAVAIADVLMGGPGRTAERALTELEERVLRRHLRAGIETMGRQLGGIGIAHMALEGHAAFESATAVLGGGEVLAVSVGLLLEDEPLPGTITVALPVRQILAMERDGFDTPATAAAALAEVPLTVMVRFPPTQASAWEMECLEPGDVLRIDTSDTEVVGFLRGNGEDIAVLTGSLGRRGAQRAVRIDSVKEEW
jgi:flagellar motor switch protein FliM